MSNFTANKQRYILVLLTLLIGFFLAVREHFAPSLAYSFQVAPLPDDNLVQNPWFRSESDPTLSALDGWTDAGGLDRYWSTSQKQSNPSPDIVISSKCGFAEVYCGTSARLSLTPGQSGGIGQPLVDSYLQQVVPADDSERKLKFRTHWVSHRIDPAEVTIYGGDSALGPWTTLWTPFSYSQDTNPTPPPPPEELWAQTELFETTIENGFNYYLVEIHARLPAPLPQQGGGVGFKITGVYFATEEVDPDSDLVWHTYMPFVQIFHLGTESAN